MDKEFNRRIIIIDDNTAIHEDFSRILSIKKRSKADELETVLFDDDDVENSNGEQSKENMVEYQMDFASQGREGVEKVIKSVKEGRPYAVAFVDMRMPPGQDGLETIEGIWKHDPNVLTIICSAYSDYSWSEITDRLGQTEKLLILKKPFEPMEVKQLAMALTEKWNLAKQAHLKMDVLHQMVDERTKEIMSINKELQKLNNDLKTEVERRRKSEQARREMQVQVIQASKLASIGIFAAGVAHEINNPLAIIHGYLDMLEHADSDQKRVSLIKKIRDANDRTRDIVNGLRVYARLDTDVIEKVNVKKCIANGMSTFGAILKSENIKIDLRYDEKESLHIKSNEGKFQQIITNLLSNARDSFVANENANITISVKRVDQTVVIEVTDNGCGIEKDNLDQIFDAFFTTKPPNKGTGLGLSIVHSLIKEFDGTISIESELEKGTCVSMMFPLYDESCVEPKLIKGENRENRRKFSGNVLVVDDERDIREILSFYLGEIGFETDEASDGDEALELVKKNKYKFIFTDLKMPKCTGEELIEKIRRLDFLTDVKIIVVTGDMLSQHQDIVDKINSILCKPFTEDEIYQALLDVEKKSK